MLDFSDQPYQYFPSKRNALVAWLMGVTNRMHRLPKTLKVDGVVVSGADILHEKLQRGGSRRDRVLFLPNHPTHADAAVFLEAQRQAGFTSQMMAACSPCKARICCCNAGITVPPSCATPFSVRGDPQSGFHTGGCL